MSDFNKDFDTVFEAVNRKIDEVGKRASGTNTGYALFKKCPLCNRRLILATARGLSPQGKRHSVTIGKCLTPGHDVLIAVPRVPLYWEYRPSNYFD